MEYVLPPQLSDTFSISLKTVYNYLSKYSDKIRTRKEYWKTVVHFEDFEKVFQGMVQLYNSPSIPEPKETTTSRSGNEDWTLNEKLWTIQKDYNIVVQKVQDLEKYNSNLEDQVSKYAILLREEKTEKKELFEKFEGLQNQYNQKVEEFSNSRVARINRYNTMLILCIVAIIIMIGLILPDILDYFLWPSS